MGTKNTKTQHVELTVLNRPGVLGRVVGHIRREGWNIKRLLVDEMEEANSSSELSCMEIDIEGANTKLAQVAEKILSLDCVISITTTQNGKRVTQTRSVKESAALVAKEESIKAPEKKSGTFRILTINPGSTSTKCAVYDNDDAILIKTIRHCEAELSKCGSILEQKDLRRKCIISFLKEAGVKQTSLDAVAGRGGLLKPIESGTYLINETMLSDLRSASAAVHASALGAIIAAEIADPLNVPAYVVDPIVVDEMDRNAKLTGLPGTERSSVFHALNQKAIARRLSEEIGKPYENARLIIAHLGGGITVGAHRYGRVIDVNDALSGEGPFTPERTGGVPALPLIKMCFSGEYTEQEMINRITKKGGMSAYLGTNDLRIVQKMINDGDEFAALVLDSMAYQVSKEIGAMSAVLEGVVDAIVLTGGLAYSNRFTGAIKQRVDKLAPMHVFAGEDEMQALAGGVLRVLRGEEAAAVYE
jgi:butyrate kinase